MPQQRAEITCARILTVAEARFAQDGYDASSVAAICAQAGVSKGAFYHHFPSKQAVFVSLLARWLGGLEDGIQATRAGAGNVPEELLGMAQVLPGVFAAAEGRLPILFEFWAQAIRDPDIWQATIAPYQRFRAFFAGIVQAGTQEGTLRAVDPETAAEVIVSMAVGVLLQGVLDPKGSDWGRVATEGLRMLLDGLRAPVASIGGA